VSDTPAVAVEQQRCARGGISGDGRTLPQIAAQLHLRSLGQRYESGFMELGLYDPEDGAFLLKVFDC
jgi:hypothetical protein